MLQRIYKNTHWLLIASIQLVLILLCVSRLSNAEIIQFYLNTDCLYLPSLFKDVLVDGNSPRGWSLTPAPYFFPDMPVYFLIYAIVQNVAWSVVIFSFIQLLLIEIFFYKVMVLISGDKPKSKYILLLSCFTLQLFLVAGAISGEPFTAQMIINSASHLGVALSSLITFYLFFTYLNNSKKKYLSLTAIMIVLSIVSDRIFVVQTVIPILCVAVYFSFKRKDYFLLLMILGSSIVGWISFQVVRRYIIYIPYEATPPYSLSQSINNFMGGFKFILRHFTVHGFILVFHLVVLVVSPFAVFRIPKNQRVMYFGLVITAVLSFVFPILYGFINAIDTFRYLMYSYILCLLIAPMIIGLFLESKILKGIAIVITIFYSGFIAVWTSRSMSLNSLNAFLQFKPDYIELVDENSSKLKNGISDYWTSKQFYQFSNKDYRVVSVHNHSEAFVWQANKKWFVGKNGSTPLVFNFSFDLKVDDIVGPPIDSVTIPNHSLYIYQDFVFKEEADGKIVISALLD